jgi:hypothetical protein
MPIPDGVDIRAPIEGRLAQVLTPGALAFVACPPREFGPTREALRRRRAERQDVRRPRP